MGQMSYDSAQLIEAVRLWTGWGSSEMPTRDDARLVQRYGDDVAAQLLTIIKALEDDFYASDARFTAADLQQMAALAAEHFKQKYPNIAEDIIQALTWCYTFDFK